VPIAVHAIRRDGFTGPIELALKDMPMGFKLAGRGLAEGHDKVRLTLTIPPIARREPVELKIEGRAVVDGKPVQVIADPTEEIMQAFLWRHLVPAKDSMITISGGRTPSVPLQPENGSPVQIPLGETVSFKLVGRTGKEAETIRLKLNQPPKGITIEEVEPGDDGLTVVLAADAKQAKPGLKGNLILDVDEETQPVDEEGNPVGSPRTRSLGTMPAMPFELVGDPPPEEEQTASLKK
jgi:hypothetical protein